MGLTILNLAPISLENEDPLISVVVLGDFLAAERNTLLTAAQLSLCIVLYNIKLVFVLLVDFFLILQ